MAYTSYTTLPGMLGAPSGPLYSINGAKPAVANLYGVTIPSGNSPTVSAQQFLVLGSDLLVLDE